MSLSHASRLGIGLLAAVSVLSACSSPTRTGTPSVAGTPTATTANGTQQAPRVPAALPVDAILADPCTALSAAQADTIGLVSQGAPQNLSGAKFCAWKSATSPSNQVSISPVPENKNGLSDTYSISVAKKYKIFQPTTVDSYPAAYSDPVDGSLDGSCSLWVGVTDQLAVMVIAQIGTGVNKSNPCPVAAKVGAAMIEHLKGAA